MIVKTFLCNLKSGESRTKIRNNFEEQLKLELKKIKNPLSVILDLRNNTGGGDEEGRSITGLFINNEEFWFKISHLLAGSNWPIRLWNIFNGKWQEPLLATVSPNKKYRSQFKNANLIVLVNSNCFSTCDGVVSSLKHAGAGKIVGQKTHGGSGDPVNWVSDYSKFTLSYTTAKVWQKNGTLIEGAGVDVDLSLIPNIKQFENDKDPILTMAIKFAKESLKKK